MIDQDTIPLTAREIEVLRLVAEGNANKQSAAILGISIKTIEKHRGMLAKKLGIHNTAGLTRFAVGSGIVDCGVSFSVDRPGQIACDLIAGAFGKTPRRMRLSVGTGLLIAKPA